MLSFLSILTIYLIVYSAQDTLSKEPFGTNFSLRRTGSGDVLTVSAFTCDTNCFYLYDMSDRSIAQLDSAGKFVKKVNLQSIGRETYIGDDFVVRNNEIIFLNAVDNRLEFFDLGKGYLKKSIPYPRYIPAGVDQRRYRLINRIFLDERSRIFIGNGHAVFMVDENVILQKVTASQVRQFNSGKLLLLFRTHNPVMSRSGTIEWNQGSLATRSSGYPLLGKNLAILKKKLYICNVDNSGITILSTGLAE